MLAPFAALETRVALATRSHLANAVAVVTPSGGGVSAEIAVVFDAEYVDAFGTQSAAPVVQGVESDFEPYRAHGATIAVRGNTYKSGEYMPDGAGWVVVRLQRASK
jgi:hypothetical protein